MSKEKSTAILFFISLVFLYILGFTKASLFGVPLYHIHTVFAGIFVILVGLFPLFIVNDLKSKYDVMNIIENDKNLREAIERFGRGYKEKE